MSRSKPMIFLLSILMMFLLCTSANALSREHVIYFLSGCGGPDAPLIADAGGNLYGTAVSGGANKNGCVFEVFHNELGQRNGITIYSFNGSDGSGPQAGLTLDKSGDLYGTTVAGGVYGGGVAFELTPSSDGEWTETVLYNFGAPDDGSVPQGQLVLDESGNLYGTTESGGPNRSGIVFELMRDPNGWTEKILHAFAGSITGPGGLSPLGGVVMDNEGNLYGVTGFGGLYGGGMVYELRLKNGIYYKRTIHSFDGYDGAEPNSLILGPDGNLYGTALFGGVSPACDCGVVFELAKATHGQWIEHTLLSLDGSFGFLPVGPPSFDDKGNLYAAAMSGGPYGRGFSSAGSVFELSPRRDGSWAEITLHLFIDYYSKRIEDGLSPYAGVIVVRNTIYGATSGGGIHNEGTVFRIKLRSDSDDDTDSDTQSPDD
jgi:uncharacterized repeat protein (TIGR03803 family)